AALLAVLSPSRTVARGYVIVRDPADARPLVSAADLRPGDMVELEMRDGRASTRWSRGLRVARWVSRRRSACLSKGKPTWRPVVSDWHAPSSASRSSQ